MTEIYEEMFRTYGDMVLRLAMARTENRNDAEDWNRRFL